MTISEMLEHIKWQLEEYQREYEKLTAESTEWESKYYELQDRINNSIDYIKDNIMDIEWIDEHFRTTDIEYKVGYFEVKELIKMLKGEDNGKDN